MMTLVISLVFHEKYCRKWFIINTCLFALDHLSLIKYYSDRIKTCFCSLTVGVLPQRTNLPYKTTSAFRTALWLMAGSRENGHANSFPASLLISGAKRFRDHMLISIFHLRREDIAWPAFNSQSPGGWMNPLSAGSHTQQPYLHQQWKTSNAF